MNNQNIDAGWYYLKKKKKKHLQDPHWLYN